MKSYAVIGCGRFGSAVAKTLYNLGNDVLVVDASTEIIEGISPFVTQAASADVMDEVALRSLGISNMDAAVIAIGTEMEASIFATLIVKELGVPMVVAKAQNEQHAKVLLKIGADRVVFPERDMGARVAHNMVNKNVLDFIELSPDYSMVEITPLKSWGGKSLAELKLPVRYGFSVTAIRRGEDIIIAPSAQQVVRAEDVLIVLGAETDIRAFEGKEADS